MANILFDLDGTIIDSRVGIVRCLQHALKELGHPVPEENELLWCIGPPLIESLRKILGAENEAQAREGVTIFRTRYGETGCFENEVYPGIPELLQELVLLGHQLYVVTAKPTVFAKKILEKLPLGIHFIEVYGCGLDGQFNDKAELIKHVLALHALDPEETYMIGDREHDIIAAKKNSIRSIGVLWGYGHETELLGNGALNVIRHPVELISILDS